MIIEVPKISPDGSDYEGEEPAEVLELENDRFAHAAGPVRYTLNARRLGSEVVVQGKLSTELKLLCGRCGDFFSTTLVVSSFLHAYEISEGVEAIDLNPDIREDVLLEIPGYPKCAWDGVGVCPFSGVNVAALHLSESPATDNRWAALDGLKKPAAVQKKTKKKG